MVNDATFMATSSKTAIELRYVTENPMAFPPDGKAEASLLSRVCRDLEGRWGVDDGLYGCFGWTEPIPCDTGYLLDGDYGFVRPILCVCVHGKLSEVFNSDFYTEIFEFFMWILYNMNFIIDLIFIMFQIDVFLLYFLSLWQPLTIGGWWVRLVSSLERCSIYGPYIILYFV